MCLVVNFAGWEVKSHPCVLALACPTCKSKIGFACIGRRGPVGGTHIARRIDYAKLQFHALEKAREKRRKALVKAQTHVGKRIPE